MNPLRCAFGVSSGKFLGFTVHRKEIDLDHVKAKGYPSHGASHHLQAVNEFYGESVLCRRFVPALAELIKPFHKLLKKNATF